MFMTELNLESRKNNISQTGAKTILLLSASPRKGQHTYALVKSAQRALSDSPSLNIQFVSFAGKKIYPCQNCHNHCVTEGSCWQNDDFETLANKWLSADGIVLGSPVYSFGPPSIVSAFFERLLALQKANPTIYTSPSWPQPVGIIAQGGSEYGGVEIAAQTLLSLCLAVGCIPISGDMPGFSQGVIGQIRDKDGIPERMIDGARRLTVRVTDFVEILSGGKNPEPVPLRFLIVKAGAPDKTLADLLDAHFADFKPNHVPSEWRWFDFNNAYINPCLGCREFCGRDHECRFVDGMQAFRQEWLAADCILWLAGNGPGNSLSPIRAAIDRMNQVRFETFFGSNYRHMPRYLKISVPIGHPVDTAEPNSTLLFLRHISLLYQNILLPQNQNNLSQNPSKNSGKPNLDSSSIYLTNLIHESIKLALTMKSGLARLARTLPEEYYPSKSRYAHIDPVALKTGDVNDMTDSDHSPF